MRLGVAAVLAALALAGCGGDDLGAGASAADAVPADAVAYIEVDANLESDQWEQVQSLLDRFPSRPQLVDELNEELETEQLSWESDIDPALGSIVAVAWSRDAGADEAVVLTQPDDEQKLQALVDKVEEEEGETYVVGEVDGWTAVAEEQAAIDALRSGGGSLSDDDAFEAALDDLPEERLAFAWARGDVLKNILGLMPRRTSDYGESPPDWFAAAVEARDDGAAATIVTRVAEAAADAYESARVDQAPGDALAFASFGAESLRSQAKSLAPFAEMFDLPIDELLEQIRGEGALWVRPAAGFPEVTLVLDVENPERARATLEDLLEDVPLDMRIGVVGGELVATTASSPEAALETGGETLADSADFTEAVETAGMPDETHGFLYVNVSDALPLLGLAGIAGVDVPRELLENLRPIRSVVAWSEVDGREATHMLFVQIE